MVKFMAGKKGEGKTRKLIEMANECAKVTDGHVVFIDDDKRHIFDLHRDIRFVEAGKGELATYRELVGYILGILSQNSDINHIYIDGLSNILENTVDNELLLKLKARLDSIGKTDQVEFVISIHVEPDSLPVEIKATLV